MKSIFIISSGSYSDYQVHMVAEVAARLRKGQS